IRDVGDDGIQVQNVYKDVTVSGNNISIASTISETGDGIVVESIGNVVGLNTAVIGNTVADIRGQGNVANADFGNSTTENDGIRVQNAPNVLVDGNVVSDVADDGIEVASSYEGDVTVSANRLDSIGTGTAGLGDGIIVWQGVAGATVSGNTVTNVLSSLAGTADNVDGYTAGDGIRVSNIPLNVMVSNNIVGNAADDGIQTKFNGGDLVITGNSVDSVSNVSTTGDGIDVTEHAGNITISSNVISRVFGDGTADPDGSGLTSGDGIRVETSTGFLIANGNSITNVGDDGMQIEDMPNSVTANNNVVADFGNLTAGSGDGIVISDTTGNVTANGNDVSGANGSTADIDDPTADAGDAIRIVRTSGTVEASNNTISTAADDGMQIETVGGAATVIGNVLSNNGLGNVGNTGILLTDFASAVVSDNTIMNVTAGSLEIGIDIGNTVGPAALITMTGNVLNDSGTGLFIRDNVMGTVTGNTFANNVVWGVQVDNGVSGNMIGMGEPGDVVPTIDILFRSNTITGNGVGAVTPGVTGGGINNLRPGPGVGGFIFDARMNDFAGQTPFTTPTHFETPSSGGSGDAVSDWVRIDVIAAAPPPRVPYYDFGSLLDNFGRGGDVETPGDALAHGAGFDQNGNLFDPYFVDLFTTAFGLSGDATAQSAIGTAAPTEYAMCVLANMWKATSCRKAPPNN
ncbi:MAG: beta strand repeat-containing protein, partial [Reyranellaceae bacterium]